MAGDEGPVYGKSRWVLLVGFALAALLEVLDVTIINPVLPTMAGNLGCTTEEIGWVSTAYLLANVVFLPMTAWFSRRFGLGRYVSVSILVFIAASALCGASHSLGEIIVWRIFQGAAGAPLISMTQAGIAAVFPKKEQNIAQGVWALCIIVAPSIAPYLGGWIADNYAWPWIFYVNVPVGILAAVLVTAFYKRHDRLERKQADWLGVGMLTVGLAAVQYVLEEGNSKDWFNSRLILQLTWIGLIFSTLFVLWELSPRNRSPIVNLRVLRDKGLAGAFIVSFIVGAAMYSGVFVFPLFAQAVLGFTPTKTGAFMLLPGVVMAFGMLLSTVAIERGAAPRDVAFIGVLICIYSVWLLGHSTPMSNESDNGIGMIIRNVGLSLVMLPLTTAGIMGLEGADVAEGAALLGLARQLGGSIGIAAAGSEMTRMTQFHRYHIMDRMTVGSPVFQERMSLFTGAFYSRGMSLDASQHAAAKVLDQQASLQAYAMAVNNVYIFTGILFVVSLPFLFLMRRGRSGGHVAAH
jgi:DHA2 family multidrug resistance protein